MEAKYLLILTFSFLTTYCSSQMKVYAPDGATKIGDTNTSPASGAKLHVSGGNFIMSGGFGGLGVTNPERIFHLRDNTAMLRIDRDTPGNGFLLVNYNSGFSNVNKSFLVSSSSYGTDNGDFSIADVGQNVAGLGTRRITITNEGNFIIGTETATSYKFRVAGNAFKSMGGSEWATISDKKAKENIRPFKGGLTEVLRIQPVEYSYNGRAGTMKGVKGISVIAQEIKKVAPYMVEEVEYQEEQKEITEKGISTGNEKLEKFLAVNPSALKWMLVNAIKEQNEEIENLKNELAETKDLLQSIVQINVIENIEEHVINGYDSPRLFQNSPNPFGDRTEIKYFLPSNIEMAQLNFLNENGNLISKKILSNKGSGKVILNTQNLVDGIYSYQLIVNGKLVSTKKMIVHK